MQDFAITSPQALVPMIPAILGFLPRRSLVIAVVADGQLGVTMRIDLTPSIIDNLDQIVELAVRQGADAVVAVVVDDTGTDHRLLIDALTVAMAERHITVAGAVSVTEITAGATWECIQDACGASGQIDDPQATPMALAAVLSGRTIFGDRSELTELIQVDQAAAAELIPVLQQHAIAPADDEAPRRSAEALLAAIARLDDGGDLPDSAALAALAAPLTDVRVRDMMFATALSDRAAAAEQLWLNMARVLPGHHRVEALCLFGFAAYSRGDGTLAGVAFDAARTEDRQHTLSRLLDEALQGGATPEVLHSAAESSYRVAEAFGVALPTRRTQTT